jgi:hypothetical protein
MTADVIRPDWAYRTGVIEPSLAEAAGQEAAWLIGNAYVFPRKDLLWPPESIAYRVPILDSFFRKFALEDAPNLLRVIDIVRERTPNTMAQLNVIRPGGAIKHHEDDEIDRSVAIGLSGSVYGVIIDPRTKQEHCMDFGPGDEFALTQGRGRRRKLVGHSFENRGLGVRISYCS